MICVFNLQVMTLWLVTTIDTLVHTIKTTVPPDTTLQKSMREHGGTIILVDMILLTVTLGLSMVLTGTVHIPTLTVTTLERGQTIYFGFIFLKMTVIFIKLK